MRIPIHATVDNLSQRFRSELRLMTRRCPRGHGGHAVDAKYCRICGLALTHQQEEVPMAQQDEHRPAVSWTDNIIWGQRARDLSVEQLRRAARAVGLPDHGGKRELVERLEDVPEPTGWKWEG